VVETYAAYLAVREHTQRTIGFKAEVCVLAGNTVFMAVGVEPNVVGHSLKAVMSVMSQ
jgi:hypothetical protein